MNKQERVTAVAAAIEQHKETTKLVNKIITDDNGTAYGFHYVAEIDSEQLGQLLVEAGFGNLRAYRAEIIELYLKGNTAKLVKFIVEEV